MDKITVLAPQERIRQDAAAIAAIYRNLGATVADELVARALMQLARAMAGLAAQVTAHDLGGLAAPLQRLRCRAGELGMETLAGVAADVETCLDAGDSTAFAAVWARLVRVAERSLACPRGIAGQSGES